MFFSSFRSWGAVRVSGAALLILAIACLSPTSAGAQTRERRAMTAYPVGAPIKVDGNLDEAFYRTVQPVAGFIQIEPQYDVPATEKTEMWVGFDRDNVYMTFRCY